MAMSNTDFGDIFGDSGGNVTGQGTNTPGVSGQGTNTPGVSGQGTNTPGVSHHTPGMSGMYDDLNSGATNGATGNGILGGYGGPYGDQVLDGRQNDLLEDDSQIEDDGIYSVNNEEKHVDYGFNLENEKDQAPRKAKQQKASGWTTEEAEPGAGAMKDPHQTLSLAELLTDPRDSICEV